LAQLDALYLTLNLPGATIKSVTYGTPRVGNPEYAAFFDKTVGDYTRINNREDLVPIIPGRFLGFAHPKGEVHIISDGHAVACSGSDNAVDAQCQIQTVPNIFEGNIIDHVSLHDTTLGIRLVADMLHLSARSLRRPLHGNYLLLK